MEFEWDPNKAQTNFTRHNVTFSEAATVFSDPFDITIADPDHSEGEFRFLSIGRSEAGRLLVVGYTERNNHIRIITAREATPREARNYAS
ncbi:MAG: BrnT family toxin [Thermodesulfobacteriota bacterium]